MNNGAKRTVRAAFLARRAVMDAAERVRCDARIRANIVGLKAWGECRAVSLYATDGMEPDLLPLLDEGDKIALFPRYVAAAKAYEFAVVRDLGELVSGRYGLLEPRPECAAAESELVRHETLHLVPGVAFDRTGTRLGRGGGFYDRLLEQVKSPIWGVFYTGQCSEERLPVEIHDRRLDGAVTEMEVLDFHEKHDF